MLFVGIMIGAVVGAGIASFVLLGPIPFNDKGFRIYAASSERARNVLVRDVLPVVGMRPRYRIDSRQVQRVLLNDNLTLINHTDPKLWERMGRPAAGLTFVVRNPMAAAARVTTRLIEAGFEAEVLGELDPDVPKGSMVFVRTNALVGTTLIFRRHFFRMGPRPPRWH